MIELPRNVALEVELLGGVLMHNDSYFKAAAIVEPDYFYDPLHREIWEEMGRLIAKGERVTPIALKSNWPDADKPIPGTDTTITQYLVRMAVESCGSLLVVSHARLLRDLWLRRQAILTLAEATEVLVSAPLSQDTGDTIETVQGALWSMQRMRKDEHLKTFGEAAAQAVEQAAAAFQGDGIGGATWGIAAVDTLAGPLFAGDVVTLLAASGHGKTAFAAGVLRHNARASLDAKRQIPGLMLEMEMDALEIARRELTKGTGVVTRAQKMGSFQQQDYERMVDEANRLAHAPLWIDDRAALTMPAIEARVRQAVRQFGVKLVVVDNLQCIKPWRAKMTAMDVFAEAPAALKELAKAEQVIVMLLAQMTRGYQREQRSWKFDANALYGGDQCKQASDLFLGLALPREWLKYREPEAEKQQEHSRWAIEMAKWKDTAAIGLFKARGGGTGDWVEVAFNAERTEFGELRG